ncbi:hypothetical protein TURU_135415 [Turdus rufiventris]|nr:hypothetical protein TURU_135415 [Turdus rufiventris]
MGRDQEQHRGSASDEVAKIRVVGRCQDNPDQQLVASQPELQLDAQGSFVPHDDAEHVLLLPGFPKPHS